MNKENKTLIEIYHEIPRLATPRLDFVKRLAEVTCRSEQTVRNWLTGTRNPDGLAKKAIAEELGRSVAELFPNN